MAFKGIAKYVGTILWIKLDTNIRSSPSVAFECV